MKPSDFAKYRRPEGQTRQPLNESSLFGLEYGLSADRLLEMFPVEDRLTVQETQRLRDEFKQAFPRLEEVIEGWRKAAYAQMKIEVSRRKRRKNT